MNKIYILIISFLPLFGFAQPTITQSDLPVAGTGWRVAQDSSYVDVIPSGGAGVTWDYTGLQNLLTDTVGFGAASGTPYESTFPTANLAAYDWTTGDWSYFTSGSSGLYSDGMIFGGVPLVYNPKLLYIPTPFTYNDAISNEARFFIDTTYLGYCVRIVSTVNSDFVADGWGTLKIPTGTYNNVLRIFVTQLTTDSILLDATCMNDYSTVFSTSASQVTQYQYLRTGAGAAYLLGIEADSMGTTSTSSEYFLNAFSGVNVNELSSSDQGLSVYPNPSNDYLHIALPENSQANAELKMYDSMGSEVFSTKPGNDTILNVPVAKFESGIYFYRYYSDDNIRSGKFTVVH